MNIDKMIDRVRSNLNWIAETIDKNLAMELSCQLVKITGSIVSKEDLESVISKMSTLLYNPSLARYEQVDKPEIDKLEGKLSASVDLTPLEKSVLNYVNTLGMTYAGELSNLMIKPKNLISSYCNRLKEKGLIYSFRLGRSVIYSSKECFITHNLFTGDGVVKLNRFFELGVSKSDIEKLCSNNIIEIQNHEIVKLTKIKPSLIIFEWGGVICKEFGTINDPHEYFDEILCQKLAEVAHTINPKRFPTKEDAERELRLKLYEYAQEHNKLWYDYYHLAEELGLNPIIIDELHEEIYTEYGGLNLTPGIKDILEKIKDSGYRICIITNAVEGVIKKRLELTGLSFLFKDEDLITSDLEEIENVVTKEDHIRLAFEETGVDPNDALIVTSFVPNIIPAKEEGLIKENTKVLCYKYIRPTKDHQFGSSGIFFLSWEKPQLELPSTSIVQYGTTELTKALMCLLKLL